MVNHLLKDQNTFALYRWKSDLFGDWQEGDIIVCADSLCNARKKVIGLYVDMSGVDKQENINSTTVHDDFDIFLNDIAEAPVVTDHAFIYGSA